MNYHTVVHDEKNFEGDTKATYNFDKFFESFSRDRITEKKIYMFNAY